MIAQKAWSAELYAITNANSQEPKKIGSDYESPWTQECSSAESRWPPKLYAVSDRQKSIAPKPAYEAPWVSCTENTIPIEWNSEEYDVSQGASCTNV